MKFAILGDIHANLEALDTVLADAGRRGAEQYISVGDLVGYNACPTECMERLKEIGVSAVMGNHDYYAGSSHFPMNFNPIARRAVEWTRDQLDADRRRQLLDLPMTQIIGDMTIVHSTLDDPAGWGYILELRGAERSLRRQTTPVCFYGHTHRPVIFRLKDGMVEQLPFETVELEPDWNYLINPGSIGQPRDGDPRTGYALYDNSARTVALYRLEYDIEAAQKKIVDAGLPEKDAERLSIGH